MSNDGSDEGDDGVELSTVNSRLVRMIVIPVAVVMVLLIALLATRETERDEVSGQLIGQPAPFLEGETTDDEVFSIVDERGNWVVVNFFATNCPPCVVEHPHLVSFDEQQAGPRGVSLVSVPFGDSPDNVAEFFAENGGDWPVVVTNDQEIGVSWGVVAVPETYVVNPFGVVVAKLVGGVQEGQLEAVLDDIQGGAT